MATKIPKAVATRASEMAGATTERSAEPMFPIAVNALMIPTDNLFKNNSEVIIDHPSSLVHLTECNDILCSIEGLDKGSILTVLPFELEDFADDDAPCADRENQQQDKNTEGDETPMQYRIYKIVKCHRIY